MSCGLAGRGGQTGKLSHRWQYGDTGDLTNDRQRYRTHNLLQIMFVKMKSQVFIDRLTFQLDSPQKSLLKAVLIDDRGSICSALETEVANDQLEFNWIGLNDLPYGVYTLEVSRGTDEMKMRLVKRV